MFTVAITHSDHNSGEVFYDNREYYELFDAQTVAEIEANTFLHREGSILIGALLTQFDYAVGNLRGDDLWEICVVDNSTGNKMPLRRLEADK